jgi:protoporphyrinogen oxidase
MFPYNSKVWCYPLEEMSYDWIGERVSVVDYRKVLGNFIFGRKDISWGKNRAFKFPLFGGTGEIFRRFIPYIKEHLFVNKEMTKIDLKTREIFFNDGSRTDYDILISTIPLDKFIEVAGLTQFSGLKNNLRHNGILSVGLGLKKSAFSDKCWVYFPESNCPFYRITYFSNYSPNNTSSGEYSSLICETAYSEFKPYPKDKVIEDTIQGLINAGVLSAEDKKRIVSTYLIDVEYAYPIPNLGRDEALNTVQPYLLQNNIYSRGRFGAWRYERGNTDYSLMQGVEAVDEILGINRD